MRLRAFQHTSQTILYIIYFCTFLYIYNAYFTAIFGYMGYNNNLSIEKIPIAIAGIIISILLIGKKKLPSNFFLHITMGLITIPTMVLFCGSNLPYGFPLIVLASFSLIALTARFINPPRLRITTINNNFLLNFLLILSIITIAMIFALGGGSYLNFNLSAVYDTRKEAANNLPALFGYINPSITKIAIPFGITIAVLLKKWKQLSIFVISGVLFFGLTSHKSVLLYPLLSLFIYYIYNKEKYIEIFILTLISIGAVSLLEFYLFAGSDSAYWFSSLFYRRALLTPSLLNWFYIDWFSSHNFYFWSDSKFTLGLIDAPSELRSVNLIGTYYFNDSELSANTGWIGSGFANAGLLGSLIYSLFIGIILSILNSYAKMLGSRIIISLFFVSIITIITSTDLVTSLLTHGLLTGFLLLAAMRPDNKKIL